MSYKGEMMATPYSEDLRIKALDLIDGGKEVGEVVSLLKISRASLFLWLKLRRETGSVAPKKDWRKGHGHKIKDLEKLRNFADQNQGLTGIEMAKKWGDLSPKTMRKWLHYIGYTQKKRVTGTKNEMKKNVKHIWMK